MSDKKHEELMRVLDSHPGMKMAEAIMKMGKEQKSNDSQSQDNSWRYLL